MYECNLNGYRGVPDKLAALLFATIENLNRVHSRVVVHFNTILDGFSFEFNSLNATVSMHS